MDLAETRRALCEAKIELKQLQQEYDDALVSVRSQANYEDLGKNEKARDIALAAIILHNERITTLKRRVAAQEARVMRLESELEILLDERRAAELRTWARLADTVAMFVDHKGRYNPAQSVRTVATQVCGEIIEEQCSEVPF